MLVISFPENVGNPQMTANSKKNYQQTFSSVAVQTA